MRFWPVGMVIVAACFAASAQAASTAVESAYGNSLIFDRPGLATCTLWLDATKRYSVFCKRPPPAAMATADGPWELESREGAYRLSGDHICLTPDAVPGSFGIVADGVLYGGSGCYEFRLGTLDSKWVIHDRKGRTYTMRLLAGR